MARSLPAAALVVAALLTACGGSPAPSPGTTSGTPASSIGPGDGDAVEVPSGPEAEPPPDQEIVVCAIVTEPVDKADIPTDIPLCSDEGLFCEFAEPPAPGVTICEAKTEPAVP